MKKIPSIFKRDPENMQRVLNEPTPACAWVFAGEGWPTRKWDGTACLVSQGKLYKRYDCKKGRTPPEGFIPAQDPDEITGHWPGWILVGDGPEDKWHREAINHPDWIPPMQEGTYELCGPKVQGNPEGLDAHRFFGHGMTGIEGNPRTFKEIKEFLSQNPMEGIVWHHQDGRMAKIKAKDFGIKR